MKEAEFMRRLEEGLGSVTGREEIIADYRRHFAEGRADGRSEEEIAASLGEPRGLAREFRIGAGESALPRDKRRILRPLVICIAVAAAAVGAGLGFKAIERANESRRNAQDGIHVSLPGVDLRLNDSGIHGNVGGAIDLNIDDDGIRQRSPGGEIVIDGSGIRANGTLVSGDSSSLDGKRPTSRISLDKRLSSIGIERTVVSGGAVNIQVVRSSAPEIRAKLSGRVAERFAKEIELRAEAKGSVARIDVDCPLDFDLRGNDEDLELLIELPYSYAADFEASSGSGDIVFSGTAGSVKLTVGSGDIEVADSNGLLELRAGSGDIVAKPAKVARTSIRSGSGDIAFKTPKGSSFAYSARSGSGDIVVGGRTMDSGGARSGIIGSGGPEVQAQTGSGDISIES